MSLHAPQTNGFSKPGAATPLEGLQLPSMESITVEGKGRRLAALVASKSLINALKKINQLDIGNYRKNIRGDVKPTYNIYIYI